MMNMELNTLQIMQAFTKTRLRTAKDREMTARNLEIFYLRVFKGDTLAELGRDFNLTKGRIAGIEAKTARQFRSFLIKNKLEI